MWILAIDTVAEGCSVALSDGDGMIERCEEMTRGHADRILGMVDEVLAEGAMALRSLAGIAVGVGPGAFTGVRISVAVGQALAYGAGLPVVPITSLEALAAQIAVQDGNSVLASLDARMGEVYWGCFRMAPDGDVEPLAGLQVGSPAGVYLPEQARPEGVRGIGRGFAAYPEMAARLRVSVAAGDARALPRAREGACLGGMRLRRGLGMDPARLVPVYLRDKVAFTEAERALQGAVG